MTVEYGACVNADEQLDDLVDRIARDALRAFESDEGPTGMHDDHLEAIRSAVWKHADSGTFRPWNVASRDEVPRLAFVVGYSLHVNRFTLNASDIAAQIQRAGWRAARRRSSY